MSEFKFRHKEGPDPDIDGDLIDRAWTPIPEDFHADTSFEKSSTPGKARSSIKTYLAILTILAVLSVGLASTIQILALPSLDFLKQSRELHRQPLIQQVRRAVVQIHSAGSGSGGRIHRGTGFNIDSSGIIVTNRHLVEDARIVAVTFRELGTRYAADWVIHPDADLALIRLNGKELPTVPLRDTSISPSSGDDIFIIGNPLGFSHTAMKGVLRSHVRLTGVGTPSVLAMLIEAPIYPGASGSPVFDESGYVIGVVFAQLESTQDGPRRGLAVSVREVHNLLRQYD